MTVVEYLPNKHPPVVASLTAARLADVAERLLTEFEDRLDLATISRVVSQAEGDLQFVTDGALAELVERSASWQ